jgi:hypothetical protein
VERRLQHAQPVRLWLECFRHRLTTTARFAVVAESIHDMRHSCLGLTFVVDAIRRRKRALIMTNKPTFLHAPQALEMSTPPMNHSNSWTIL